MQLDAHGCPACPHPAIGPAIIGSPDVRVNKRPALRVDDTGVHAACCGTNTWTATQGSPTVMINGKAAHRMTDAERHCGGIGKLVEGSPNVVCDGATSGPGAAPGGGSGGGGGGGAGGGAGGAGSSGGSGGGGSAGSGASGSGAGPAAPASPATPPAAPPVTPIDAPITPNTIVLELRMTDGTPAAFRSFRLQTPDGETRSGILDADGRARFDDLSPGDCQLSFPGLDGREWSPA